MSCTTTPIVVFDYPGWILRFPEFAAVPQGKVQLFFDEASLLCDNTASSPLACNPSGLALLLNLLTAHIASLNGGLNASGGVVAGSGPGLVGRIESATEGSVSVSTGYDQSGDGPSASWYLQTPYGAEYWALTAGYRTWQYHIGPERFAEWWGPYGGMASPWRVR